MLTSVAASVLQADVPLADAIASLEFLIPARPNVVIVEPDMSVEIVDSLIAKGHELRTAPELGRVNAIYCPGGVKSDNQSCAFVNDPRGFGLAVGG